MILPKYIVKGCGEGWYGMNCSQQCVRHCRKRDTCNHVTGQCDGGCAEGWYGNCSQQCLGHCKDNKHCNHTTGHCDEGCVVGWTGSMCDAGSTQSLIDPFLVYF